jgi:hypothetical protein
MRRILKLNAPKQVTWIISLILGVLGLLGNLVTIPLISGISFWLVVVGLALLLLATLLKDL